MADIERLKKYAADCFADIDDATLETLARYADAVVEKNKVLNLTTITERAAFVDKHLLDSLACASLAEVAGEVCDVGCGAGFPGAVIAAARPDARVTLLDATAKKLRFVKETCAALGIDAATLHARAEEAGRAPLTRESFDCVTARAVAALAPLCELCLPLVRAGGYFVAMKGPDAAAEVEAARGAIAKLGGELARVDEYSLPDGDSRALVVIKKTSPTPPKYPRAGAKIARSPIR